ncbi:hypothetical protein AADEFJLK_02544 [Methylovulum psychrotolerans]|uniref:Uncharacterized protein n=2 Tax=Methylovulum psychrotolerans TaxID=1704499 RepID=A0A2S5CLL1_9GAMM|nr:hypothetical protein AADEFJLK_02544 [Methylovulum psychrotolerans]
MVKLADFTEWAANVGYEMPTELHSLLDKSQPDQERDRKQEPMKVNPYPDKPLDPREQNSLLKIIAALCEKAGVSADQDGLDKELEKITETLGVLITARVIKKHLRKAAELVK